MHVVIAGAGLVGGELTKRLVENKHDVVVIEPDKVICDKLYAETGAVVIHGSAAQAEVLAEAELHKADVLIAATGSDADNLAVTILGKSFGVPRVVVRMRDPAYENAYKLIGVNSILRVTNLMVNQMIMEIEQPKVRRITTIGRGKADIFAVTVPDGANIHNQTVKDIAAMEGFPSQCVFIAAYNRQSGDFSLPRGDHAIHQGDEIFMISTPVDIKKAVSVLTEIE
jgi:trk system potassium uptake protein TrkA